MDVDFDFKTIMADKYFETVYPLHNEANKLEFELNSLLSTENIKSKLRDYPILITKGTRFDFDILGIINYHLQDETISKIREMTEDHAKKLILINTNFQMKLYHYQLVQSNTKRNAYNIKLTLELDGKT
jgi:hypothetical protein